MKKCLTAEPQGDISLTEAPSSEDSIACVKLTHKTTHYTQVCLELTTVFLLQPPLNVGIIGLNCHTYILLYVVIFLLSLSLGNSGTSFYPFY